MEKLVLLLLALGFVTIAECRNLNLIRKRAPELSLVHHEVCIEGIGCHPSGWTAGNETWLGPELGNFIAQLVEKNGVLVEDIHIINRRLDVYVTGKKKGHLLPKVDEIVQPKVDEIVPPKVDEIVPPKVDEIVPPKVDEIVPPKVDEIVPPKVDEIVPPKVDEIVPPEVHKIVFKPMDCQEVMEAGHNETGVYEVWPKGAGTDGQPVRVRCDMDTDGGGWTVIQRRGNFSKQENFDRNWRDYKNGFGDPSRDYWIGNDNIYALSNQGSYAARFDMMDSVGNTAYELFREFRIENENSKYKLHISKSSGTAGDSMTVYNGRMFSTKDRDNDRWKKGSCSVKRKSGFWWNSCSMCNPNGVYRPTKTRVEAFYMYYWTWNDKRSESLFAMEIKLKRL